MRRSVAIMIEECNSRMSGYAVLLNYRYMNLCVKAEAASLLNVTVRFGDQNLDIENVADVTIAPDDFHFEVYPKDDQMLPQILKGIKTAHPEFGADIKTLDENTSDSDASDEDKYILLTMPEVNDDRYDLLKNAVGSLYEECKLKLDVNFQKYTGKLVAHLAGSSAESQDEAKESLQEVYDSYKEMIKGYREEKEKEIEEAHKSYMKERAQRESEEREEAEAHGEGKGLSMKLNLEEDE